MTVVNPREIARCKLGEKASGPLGGRPDVSTGAGQLPFRKAYGQGGLIRPKPQNITEPLRGLCAVSPSGLGLGFELLANVSEPAPLSLDGIVLIFGVRDHDFHGLRRPWVLGQLFQGLL